MNVFKGLEGRGYPEEGPMARQGEARVPLPCSWSGARGVGPACITTGRSDEGAGAPGPEEPGPSLREPGPSHHCYVATPALMAGLGVAVVGGRWLRSKQLSCVALFLLHDAAVTPCSHAAVSFFGRWKFLPLIVCVRASHTTLSFASWRD